jgi:hypothetical protein
MSNGDVLADTNSLVYAYQAGGPKLIDTYLDAADEQDRKFAITRTVFDEIKDGPLKAELGQYIADRNIPVLSAPDTEQRLRAGRRSLGHPQISRTPRSPGRAIGEHAPQRSEWFGTAGAAVVGQLFIGMRRLGAEQPVLDVGAAPAPAAVSHDRAHQRLMAGIAVVIRGVHGDGVAVLGGRRGQDGQCEQARRRHSFKHRRHTISLVCAGMARSQDATSACAGAQTILAQSDYAHRHWRH